MKTNDLKRLFLLLSIVCLVGTAEAQTVTRTQHRAAVAADAVSTGTVTVRKPDYICISTNNGKEQLIMDGTAFTMTIGGRQHTTNSKKNAQFDSFHQVLKAVINHETIPACEDMTIKNTNGVKTFTITPKAKKRQLFNSFVLVIDSKSSTMKTLRMNGRGGDYTEYSFK